MKKFICAGIFLFGLTGCYKNDWESAKAENEKLASENSQLKTEIQKLKETAQYYFQQGQEQFSSNQYEKAIVSFKTVMDKFPNDPLEASAQKALGIAQQKQDSIGIKVSENRFHFISGTAASKRFSDKCFDIIETSYMVIRGDWEERGISMSDRVGKFTRNRDELNGILAFNKCECAMRGMSEKGSIPGGNCSVIKEKPIEGVDTLYLQLLSCK